MFVADEKRATEKTKKMEELYETTTKEERMKIDKEREDKQKIEEDKKKSEYEKKKKKNLK